MIEARTKFTSILALGLLSFGCASAADMPSDFEGSTSEEESLGETQQYLNTAPNEGLYRFSPKNAPHKSWDLPGACPGQNNGAKLALFHYDGHNCSAATGDQKWYVKYIGNDGQNYYEIRQGSATGKCLDIEGGGATNNLLTWDCNGGNWQRWYFTEMEAMTAYGHWKIKSRHNGKVIDLDYGNTENATKIQVWDDYNNDAQKWIITRVDPGYPGLVEDWSDDFTSLNGANWNVADWNAGFVNGEEQRYKPSRVWVDGGRRLRIEAKNTDGGTGMNSYESGRVNSKNKRYFKEGAFSARLKYSEGGSLSMGSTGTWPAFWILGQGINEHPVYSQIEWYDNTCGWGSNWPRYGSRELDIWEYARNRNNLYYIAGHAGDQCQNANFTNGNPAYSRNDSPFDPNAYAVYKVVFDGAEVKFYMNGALQKSFSNGHWLNQDMFFILNMAVGGGLGGDSNSFNDAGDWANLDIDFVAHEHWW